ncbi:hypothetical protein EsH8_IX_000189 [Colletotrichum jinshuiense]
MSSTAPAHGSADTHDETVRIVDQQDAQAQEIARLQKFLADQSLGHRDTTGTARPGPSHEVYVAIGNVNQLGLGHGAVGQHDGNVPTNLRGVGAHFPNRGSRCY